MSPVAPPDAPSEPSREPPPLSFRPARSVPGLILYSPFVKVRVVECIQCDFYAGASVFPKSVSACFSQIGTCRVLHGDVYWRPDSRRQIGRVLSRIPSTAGAQIMSKERSSSKESKKKPAMSPKEKKAAKQSKKESKNVFGS